MNDFPRDRLGKKIIIFLTRIPYPLHEHGLSVRYFPIIEYLSKSHILDLVIFRRRPERKEWLRGPAKILPERVLCPESEVPAPRDIFETDDLWQVRRPVVSAACSRFPWCGRCSASHHRAGGKGQVRCASLGRSPVPAASPVGPAAEKRGQAHRGFHRFPIPDQGTLEKRFVPVRIPRAIRALENDPLGRRGHP